MAKQIVSIPHKFRLASAINFRKDYSPPPLVRHLDPTGIDAGAGRRRGAVHAGRRWARRRRSGGWGRGGVGAAVSGAAARIGKMAKCVAAGGLFPLKCRVPVMLSVGSGHSAY